MTRVFRHSQQPMWHRRLQVYGLSIFCMVCISYLMIFGTDNRMNEDIIDSAFLLLSVVNGFYHLSHKFADKPEATVPTPP